MVEVSRLAAMSNTFMALIWWVLPAMGLIGGIGYAVWISRFKAKFESQTMRSVGTFQKFQNTFREKRQSPPESSHEPQDLPD